MCRGDGVELRRGRERTSSLRKEPCTWRWSFDSSSSGTADALNLLARQSSLEHHFLARSKLDIVTFYAAKNFYEAVTIELGTTNILIVVVVSSLVNNNTCRQRYHIQFSWWRPWVVFLLPTSALSIAWRKKTSGYRWSNRAWAGYGCYSCFDWRSARKQYTSDFISETVKFSHHPVDSRPDTNPDFTHRNSQRSKFSNSKMQSLLNRNS